MATSWTFGPGGMFTATWGITAASSGTPGTPQAGTNALAAPVLTVTLTAGGGPVASFTGDLAQAAVAQAAVNALGPWVPADAGFGAWNYDPVGATGTSIMTSGTVYLYRINIRNTITCSNVAFIIGTAGSSLTAGQNFAGLYDSTGARIGITADQTTPWASAGLQTMALAGGPFTLSAGFYWMAALSVGTTPPTLLSATGTFRASNAGTAVAVARYATNGTGATALPASVTPASNTLSSPAIWAALS